MRSRHSSGARFGEPVPGGPEVARRERPGGSMTFVVTEPCIKCKYTDCVAVCPVDCFHEGKNFMVIDPVECIDCGACEPECPTSAIYAEGDVPDEWQEYIPLNVKLTAEWPLIKEKRDPLDDADDFKEVRGKRSSLAMAPGP
jgi:ferredoxin